MSSSSRKSKGESESLARNEAAVGYGSSLVGRWKHPHRPDSCTAGPPRARGRRQTGPSICPSRRLDPETCLFQKLVHFAGRNGMNRTCTISEPINKYPRAGPLLLHVSAHHTPRAIQLSKLNHSSNSSTDSDLQFTNPTTHNGRHQAKRPHLWLFRWQLGFRTCPCVSQTGMACFCISTQHGQAKAGRSRRH